jgi:indole-3-glycerol phosphate synthase
MLGAIVAATRQRVAESCAARPAAGLDRLARLVPPAIDLAARLRRPGVQLIAEIKRRSPSRGDLRPDLVPATLATAYADGGAAAISVLTEPDHFGGALGDLMAARIGLRLAGFSLPLLRKDFIIDPYQVVEARAHGADAVLLIVAALAPAELAALYAEARRWGMSAVVEVHDEAQLERALAVAPQIVGINSRNLHDLSVDLRVIERLRSLVPAGTLVVAESGIRSPEEVPALRALGVDAMLVGEALVCAACPLEAARQLVEAGR